MTARTKSIPEHPPSGARRIIVAATLVAALAACGGDDAQIPDDVGTDAADATTDTAPLDTGSLDISTGDPDVRVDTGPATCVDSGECSGSTCVTYRPSAEGICRIVCTDDASCGPGSVCLTLQDEFGFGVLGCVPEGTCVDHDDDGFGSGACPDVDCDDENPAAYPGGEELCDVVDNDCDTIVDEAATGTLEACDTTASGICTAGFTSCDQGAIVCIGSLASATEICDGIDSNCNGRIDDDAAGSQQFYPDRDGDGFGNPDATPTFACEPPIEYVNNDGDCDDSAAEIYPGAPEPECASTSDFNCDGETGFSNLDGDDFVACLDCDDRDENVHPDVAQDLCNATDDDCDGAVDEDFATADCQTDDLGECAAGNLSCVQGEQVCVRSQSPTNELCDGLDNDCDGSVDESDGPTVCE